MMLFAARFEQFLARDRARLVGKAAHARIILGAPLGTYSARRWFNPAYAEDRFRTGFRRKNKLRTF
jgi:hypothetical protein